MNPFAALGLPARAGLTDEEVRAAWRRLAARTHPDRDDGGDPAAYTAAATAYAQLRTPWGRSEALADFAAPSFPPPAGPGTGALRRLAILPARVRHGRPFRLVARAIAAAAVAALALAVIPGSPSAPAIITGCALWLAFTAPADLAPPPGR